MDKLGTPAECQHVRALLRKKFTYQEKAATVIGMSKFKLSRILNGAEARLEELVMILIAAGILTKKKYRYPKDDLSTFYFLNGIIETDLMGNEKTKGGKNGR